METDPFELLERSSYLSLSTRKRSGEWVPTPVWFAPHNGSYYIFSAGDAGKVKRLRNFSEVRIAACTVTGTLTGEWLPAQGRLLDQAEDIATALAALRAKYGWQMHGTDLLSRLSGKMQRRRYICIDPLNTTPGS